MSDVADTNEPLDDKLLDHEYDGIREFDNRLPNWWLWTLHLAILFSFIYWFAFRWMKDYPTSAEQLAARISQIESQAAASSTPLTNDQLWEMATNEEIVSDGRDVFVQNCSACHGENLEGGPGGGPSLVDATWIHGGNPEDIAYVIREGVAAKGMPTWKDLMSSKNINAVVAFVISHHAPPADAGQPPTESSNP